MKKTIIQVVCAIVFIYSAYELVVYASAYSSTKKELKQVQQVYEMATEVPRVEEEEKTLRIRPRFQRLVEMNENIVGWIHVPGSQLDNPILQAEDNDYYLHHNHLDEKSRAGSVFMDYRNDVSDIGRHTILYGHVMRNGTMFGELAQFAQQAYADGHRKISFSTLYKNYELLVFAAYETTTDFYYIETNFADDEAFSNFLVDIRSRSDINMPVNVLATDKIVTLSTCTTSLEENERFVVHAKLVEK